MVNKNVAQKAVVAALSGMMALAPAAPALAAKIDLGWSPIQIRQLVKDSGGVWKRLAGDDRYATNVVANDYAYSEKYTFVNDNAAVDYYAYDIVDVAIVASGDNFADALAASGLSGAETILSYDNGAYWYKPSWGLNTKSDGFYTSTRMDVTRRTDDPRADYNDAIPAPIILTKKDSLSASAKDLLDDLAITKVIVLGGEASVSEDVVNQIKDLGIDVDRVAGKDRAATSVEALKYMAARYNRLNGIVVCTGSTFADALSIAPVAIREGYGVVFTQPDGTLSEDAVKAIKDVKGRVGVNWTSENLIIVGGEKSVPNSVIGQLAQDGLSFRRIDGNNRYLTSVKIAKEFFGAWWSYDLNVNAWLYSRVDNPAAIFSTQFNKHAYDVQSDGLWITDATKLDYYWFLDGAVVADGENYPDALTAGPIAAMMDEPVILVSDDSTAGIKFLKQSLGIYQYKSEGLNKNNNLIVGGEKSVSKATKDKLEDIDDFSMSMNDWALYIEGLV